jgi:hypothetical protein
MRGLFENVERETMKHLHKKGDVVNVFQLSFSKGLLFEGKATILKPLGNPQDEHYMVRFHGKDGKPSLGEDYERFIDRDGQDDPQTYIAAFNKKLATPA